MLYCLSGLRSLLAGKVLHDLGYTNVTSMAGGIRRWKELKLPLVKDQPLTSDQMERYSRHFMLAQVGEPGQKQLLRSKALLIGAGGLGSPTAFYLAAAGVGTLGIVDDDVVDLSNLQRQILHRTSDVGRPKVESARDSITALNPDVTVIPYAERLTVDNIERIIKDYDVIVDGSDNFATRYLVNDACYLAGKPNVHGSIFQFEGMVTVLAPGRGPCYRCLYPVPPPAGARPVLKRSRRPGRAPRTHRGGAGDRDRQAAPRQGRVADRPAPDVRRARHALPRGAAPPGPEVPALRRRAGDPRPVDPRGGRRTACAAPEPAGATPAR